MEEGICACDHALAEGEKRRVRGLRRHSARVVGIDGLRGPATDQVCVGVAQAVNTAYAAAAAPLAHWAVTADLWHAGPRSASGGGERKSRGEAGRKSRRPTPAVRRKQGWGKGGGKLARISSG